MERFPQALYKADGETRLVHDVEGFTQALASGWHESLEEAATPAEDAPAAVASDRDQLEARAAGLGIKVDGRWSDARLEKAIADHLAK